MTERQRQVFELVKKGMTNRQIGEELGIAEGTVKIHVNRLLAMFHCHNRVQLSHRSI